VTSVAILATPAFGASCATPGSTTLVHTNDLRIYRQNHAVWVCSTLYGRRIRLARDARNVGLFRRPSRRTFAYAVIASGGQRGVFGSRDLKTGGLLRGHVDSDQNLQLTLHRLVATPDGSIAYIYDYLMADHFAGVSVQKVDRSGFSVLDDSGCVEVSGNPNCSKNIDTTFLTIAGGVVQWMDNSMIQSAPFA
jgi:hypothetical protein